MENLRVTVTVSRISCLAANSELPAARAEYRRVRQQYGCSMVTAIDIFGGQLFPFLRHRIPLFGDVDRFSWGQIVEARAAGPSCDEDVPVRENRRVMLA